MGQSKATLNVRLMCLYYGKLGLLFALCMAMVVILPLVVQQIAKVSANSGKYTEIKLCILLTALAYWLQECGIMQHVVRLESQETDGKRDATFMSTLAEVRLLMWPQRSLSVVVIDGSGMNAYAIHPAFSKPMVVLTKSMLHLTKRQLACVLAHEIAHLGTLSSAARHFVLAGETAIRVYVVFQLCIFLGLELYTSSPVKDLTWTESFLVALICVVALIVYNILATTYSRVGEYVADARAICALGPDYRKDLIQVLAESMRSIWHLNPFLVPRMDKTGWFATHPSLFEREKALDALFR